VRVASDELLRAGEPCGDGRWVDWIECVFDEV